MSGQASERMSKNQLSGDRTEVKEQWQQLKHVKEGCLDMMSLFRNNK